MFASRPGVRLLLTGVPRRMLTRPRASFVCIGDEVLNGKTADTNTHTLATQLYGIGVELVCLCAYVGGCKKRQDLRAYRRGACARCAFKQSQTMCAT